MSSALAIAAVTACLKDLLNDGLLDHDLSSLGSFSITAQPPDRITTGDTEANQLNLFLYQVTPNSGWRNVALPSRAPDGTRISNPPLALDLHYLLTAYGAQDLNAEVLFGYAMQLMHENSVLTRGQIRIALGAPSPVDGTLLPGPFGRLSALDLADQVELIKITPVYLTSEDLSKLWTAMQARYRPSMAYMVSVVLIQSNGAARAALPVLKRGSADRGPDAQAVPPPELTGIRSAVSELLPAVRLGDDVLISGRDLPANAAAVVFTCARLGISQELPPGTRSADGGQLRVHLPSIAEVATGMNGWGIGAYTVALRIAPPGQPSWLTDPAPASLVLAPLVTVNPLAAAPGTLNLTVICVPRLRPIQAAGARLLLGTAEAIPTAIDTPADESQPTTLTFSIAGVVAGSYIVRLRIDGIDNLPVTITGSPPVLNFDPQQTVTVS
jgi:hypothetical protein